MRLLIYALYTYIVAVRAVLYIFEVLLRGGSDSKIGYLQVYLLRNTCIFFMSAKAFYHSYSDFSSGFYVLEENTER